MNENAILQTGSVSENNISSNTDGSGNTESTDLYTVSGNDSIFVGGGIEEQSNDTNTTTITVSGNDTELLEYDTSVTEGTVATPVPVIVINEDYVTKTEFYVLLIFMAFFLIWIVTDDLFKFARRKEK